MSSLSLDGYRLRAELAQLPEERRGVLAAKAEAVDEDAVDWLVRARGIRDVVQVAVGVWCLQVDRWRNRSCFNGLDGGEAGNGAGATQEVADHALWGADRNLVGVITERALDRLCFCEVIERRAGAVRHDVADISHLSATVFDRLRHGCGGATSRWLWCGDVIRVGGCASAKKLGANRCVARLRVCE